MRECQATTCFITRDKHARSRLVAGLTQLSTGRCSDTLQVYSGHLLSKELHVFSILRPSSRKPTATLTAHLSI
jgi:hypothetical protein